MRRASGERRARRGLDADDADLGPQCVERDRDPCREPAAADGDHHGRRPVGELLGELEPERPLAGDDARVLEGVHERGSGLLRAGECERGRLVEALARQLDLGPVAPSGVDLRHGRGLGDEDRRGDAGLARRPRNRLPVVPGARRDDAGGALVRGELRDRVERAPDLERACPLEVLGLEQHRPAREAREGLRREHRRDARDAGETLLRLPDVVDRRARGRHPPAPVTASTTSETAVRGSTSRRVHALDGRLHGRVHRHRLARAFAETGDGERLDLAAQVPLAPPSELAAFLEAGAPRLERLPQLGHALSADRVRQEDRWPPLAVGVERHDRADLLQHRLRARVVHLVHDDHVRDLHDPGLQRLHGVARAGHQHEEDDVGDADHLDLALARPDGLEEDDVLPGRVHEQQRLERRLGEPAEVPTRPHRADVDGRVEEVVGETDPVAQERPTGEGARRVDRDDADRAPCGPHLDDERADERVTCRRRAAP